MRLNLNDLAPGVRYSVQVRAMNDTQTSPWSQSFDIETVGDTTAPNTPTGVTASMSGTTFVLDWNSVTLSTDGSPATDLDKYVVLVESPGHANTMEYSVVGQTRFQFTYDMNLSLFGAPRGAINMSVRAVDRTGNSSPYSAVQAQSNPAPPNPTGVTAEAIADGVSIKWSAVVVDDLLEYRVYTGTTAGTQNTLVWKGTGISAVIPTVDYSTDRWYRVTAVDVFETNSSGAVVGPIRPKSGFEIDTTAPGTPTGTAATITTTAGQASMVVSWTNPSNPEGDLAGTVVGYRPVGASDWSYTNVDYTLTSTRIDNLRPYVNYEVRTRAFDWAANYSAWTTPITTNTAATNTAPATVTGVAITAGRESINVSWTENTEDDVKNGAGVYLVQIATNSGFTIGLLEYRTGATQIAVSGLAQSQTYYARVKAVDSAGLASASWSTAVNAVTGTISDFKYTTSATEPTVKNIGDIWMDTASGFEKQWTGSGWANTGNASIAYVTGQTNTLVKNYVTEYAVNSSEVTPPASGWSTATPTRTPGTFIWYRVVVTYGNNTTSTTSPALLTGNTGATGSQGIKGDPGDDGVSLYTWLKYADSPTTGMSDTPAGKTYIGLAYNKTSSTESTNYGDYQWSLIKGEQGIPGNPGADGQTTYTWVKYGDSPTTGMSDSPAGKTYIGLAFNKTTATESSTYGDYQWSLIQGPQGTPAPVVALTATSQVLTSPAAGGATSPATSTVTGTATNTTITVWEYSVNGAAFSNTVPAGVSRTGNVVTITGSTMTARTITVRMADANGVADTLTVAKVLDGATGATGGTGSTGPAGADAYTVLLTNESHTFPGSTSAALAGSTATSVVAFKGTTQQNATIGTITGQVTGLTTAITNNGTNNATVTVTVTTALTTQSGVLTIPITVDGQTFSKRFSWSVAYTGQQGSQGIPGNPGNDGQTFYTWIKYADTPTTGMSDSPTGKTYFGIASNKTSATESSNYADYQWSLIKGADGNDGKGISSTVVNYAKSTDGVNAPGSGWGTSIPSTVAGEFLWTRTVTTYTDTTSSTAYSVAAHGATGSAGVGISGTTVTYQVHTNGTTAPTGTWLSTVPATTTGQFLWTRTVTTYTSGSPTTAYSVAAHGATGAQGIPGNPGADGTTTYTWVKYADSAAGAGLTDDPAGKTYIGLAFNKTTATESTTPGDYQWSLIQGPQGSPGAPAATINLTATTQVLTSPAGGGATSPTTAVVTGTATNTTITVWQYSVDGAAFSGTVPTGVSRTGNVVTITGSTMTAKTIAVRMADANGIADTLTVAKVFDGATGGTGGTGPAGADAYTVILSNEAQVFPGSTTAALAGSTTSTVIAYKGATQQTATVGTITGQVTGLTTSIASNGTTAPVITVTVTTALTALNGVLTIPITVDGKVFTKTFSWSVTREGAAGATGGQGPSGVSVTSITPYFQTTASGAAAPAKPTASPPPAPWTATEPNYAPNTDLWRTERIIFSNATFAYTDVTKVSSYAAAATAIATADGKNKIYYSTGTPGTTANVAGDRWVRYDGSNNIIGEWRGGGGTTWTQMSIDSQFIANLDAGKFTANTAFITTVNIGAGGVIQSAGYTSGGSSGFQLGTSGLVIKGTGNVVAVEAVAAGTISAKTIIVGAGGTLNVDSTGQIKSNNYAANSTGYRLSNSGLEINDGSIDAKALRTNTAVIGDLIIGRSADNAGSIQSFGYVQNVSGFKLDKTGLEINQGNIAAAALKIQSSPNMMPPAYADFEYGNYYYIGSFWNPRGQGKLWVSGGLANANLYDAGVNVNWKPRTGTRYMGITTLTNTYAMTAWFGESATDYNIEVEPGQKYIYSGYFKNVSANNTQWNLVVKGSNGSTIVTTPINLGGGVNQTTYTRAWTSVTIPAGVTGVIVGLSNTNTTLSKDFHMDSMQFEPAYGRTDPTLWSPPAVTAIHPAGIQTGAIQSNNSITVSGATQPAWSINTEGNLQLGDALVRGKLIVGSPGEAYVNLAPGNGDFEANVTGYSVVHTGAVSPVIARTTTVGERISGTGSARISSSAGTKSRLGMGFAVTTVNGGETLRIMGSARVNTTNAGSTIAVALLNSSGTQIFTDTLITAPTSGAVNTFDYEYTVQSGENVATIQLFHSGTITSTIVVFDDITVYNKDTIGSSYVTSPDFFEGSQGWRIWGDGNVEFNSGFFRGTLGAGTVTAEALTADMVISSNFRTGTSGRRVSFGQDGIQLYDVDDTKLVDMPVDPERPSSFYGDLVATSLTVADQLAIRGSVNELSRGATLTIASGTTAPQSPPTVTVGFEQWNTTHGDPVFNPYRYGLAKHPTLNRLVFMQDIFGGATQLWQLDGTTFAPIPFAATGFNLRTGIGGVTVIGSVAYALGQDNSGVWRIEGRNLSTNTVTLDVAWNNTTPKWRPAIGTDGTNLIIAYVATSNRTVYVQTISTAGVHGAILTTGLVFPGAGTINISSVGKGVYDFATTKYVIAAADYPSIYVLNADGTRPVAASREDWSSPGSVAGLEFANLGTGGAFYAHDAKSARMYRFSNASWLGAPNETQYSTWHVANTWYDSNATGTTHETTLGPTTTFRMQKRAMVTVTSPPLPIRPIPNTADDVTAVGVYMARGGTKPDRTKYQRQGFLADGVRTVTYHALGGPSTSLPAPGANATTLAPSVNGFAGIAGVAAGSLRSSNDRFTVDGNGVGSWGPFTVNTSGLVNVPITTATGMKMHIQDYSGGTTDSTGFISINHSCGFTPTAAFVAMRAPGSTFATPWGADSFSSTSARVRFIGANTTTVAAIATGAFSVLFVG